MAPAGGSDFVAEIFANAEPARPALIDRDVVVNYGDLARRIDERAEQLALRARAVVLLSGTNSTEFVVTYLALLRDGHVPLLAGNHAERLAAAWTPAAVVTFGSDGIDIEHRCTEARNLHPDLALLLSTSGSTGAPKLVRLSGRNLSSNAKAITEYLGLAATDRAITSLPLHYCYGLSVLHSHLVAGASVVLTDASVVDPCFTATMHGHGVTNVAGVPHTFDLLERAGPDRLNVPTLRLITQAGGRMDPAAVRRWLDRGDRWGASFYVMYGQTEATARMAFLPPALARRNAAAIGVAVPGGSLTVRPVDGQADGTGELVYQGPNVMMGYAVDDVDLAHGATLTELRTGDLGRFDAANGVVEIVGRRSRFVKPFGVRIDLDAVERELAAMCSEVAVAGDDEHLVVVATGRAADDIRTAVSALTGLPSGRIAVDDGGPAPRTESGKVDYDALLSARPPPTLDARPAHGRSSVASIYADVLGRTNITAASSFVSLGGDSLSYVECSLRLERAIGFLPENWHLRTVEDLDAVTPQRRAPRLDTTVLLRALSICAVVSTHMKLHYFPGGAHIMLAIVGYNVSRFLIPITATAERVRAGLRTAGRAAVPTVLWVAAGIALTDRYGPGTLALINNYTGPRAHPRGLWHFWFVEAFVHLTLITIVLLAIPIVRRAERRFHYAFPLALFLALLLFRFEWVELDAPGNLRFKTHGVAWFFALGWLIHRSDTRWQRLLTSSLCILTIPGFFDRTQREVFIAACLVALVWLRDVPFPRTAMRPVGVVASASLWILITHFSVFPPLQRTLGPVRAYVVTILIGVLTWTTVELVMRVAKRGLATVRTTRSVRRPAVNLAPVLD